MRYLFIVLSILFFPVTSARAEVSIGIGIGFPNADIGINVSAFPELVLMPGYPVYYDPRASSNYFFYDGLYWVYQRDNWYVSDWYDGPWQSVEPEFVPDFVLRIPVRYYRHPPGYFRGWRADAPPRWGERWGRDWERRRGGWYRWDRRFAPLAAPLPFYQRQYLGGRYPRELGQQQSIRARNYRFQPREAVTQQRFQQPGKSDTKPQQPMQQMQRDQTKSQDKIRENKAVEQDRKRKDKAKLKNEERQNNKGDESRPDRLRMD